MGLGRLLTRSTRYTATDTVTGASATYVVVDGLAPDFVSPGTYRGVMSIPGAWRASVLLSDLLGQFPWDCYREYAGQPARSGVTVGVPFGRKTMKNHDPACPCGGVWRRLLLRGGGATGPWRCVVRAAGVLRPACLAGCGGVARKIGAPTCE